VNFCEKCAAPLEETVRIIGFTTDTGRPRYEFRRQCPKRGRFFFTSHTVVRLVALSREEAEAASDWAWHGA